MPIRLRSRAKPTHHRRPARGGGGGTIPTEDNSPVAFSTSPNIVIILFRLPSSLLSSRRFFNRYPGILIAPAFRFTTQPLLPTCCESVAFGYKRRGRRRDTDSIAPIRKREADFLDRDSKRFILNRRKNFCNLVNSAAKRGRIHEKTYKARKAAGSVLWRVPSGLNLAWIRLRTIASEWDNACPATMEQAGA